MAILGGQKEEKSWGDSILGFLKTPLGKGLIASGMTPEQYQQYMRQNHENKIRAEEAQAAQDVADKAEGRRIVQETVLGDFSSRPEAYDAAKLMKYGFDGKQIKTLLGEDDPSSSPEYGVSPLWAVDGENNPAVFQLSKGGGSKRVEFPEGFTPSGAFEKAYGSSKGSAQGKHLGQMTASATGDIKKGYEFMGLIDKAIAHPGREAATGASSMFNSMAVPGSDRTNYLTLAKQMKGKNFLTAFESLKGGGTITEVEGLKAEEAQSRMNEAQSEDEYLEALREMKALIASRIDSIRSQTGTGQRDSEGWGIVE